MKDNLRQHVKAVHEGITHQCEYCSHKASTPNNLHQHVESVHKESNIILITATIKFWNLVILVNI